MDRMKTFFKYFMAVVILVILTKVVGYFLLQSNYKDISYTSNVQNLTVNIAEVKATNVNGYVKGRIKNDTEENIENKYLKFDLFTKRGVNVGTKYVKIDKIEPRSFQDFEAQFRFDKVEEVKISLVEGSEYQKKEEEQKNKKLFDFNFGLDNLNNNNVEWGNNEKFLLMIGIATGLWIFGF